MLLVTHIPCDKFCKGCWNYWFYCDCVNDFLEDGELHTSDENQEDNDDNDNEENDGPPNRIRPWDDMDPDLVPPFNPNDNVITPSPVKRPKPNPGGLPDPQQLFDDGDPFTIDGNPGTLINRPNAKFVPDDSNQIPVSVVLPPAEKGKALINLPNDIQIEDFIKDGKFTWNLPGRVQDPYVLDPERYYRDYPDPQVWPSNMPVLNPDGTINASFRIWFDLNFIPSILSKKGAVYPIVTGQELKPSGIYHNITVACHVDKNGKSWYLWMDKNQDPHLTETPPSFADFFMPELYFNDIDHNLVRKGVPRSGRRPLPYPSLSFPDSYVDFPINRRGTSGLENDPQLNNPSNSPGLTGDGSFVNIYRGTLVQNFNVGKFVIPYGSGVTNQRTTFRSVNGNLGNADTFVTKSAANFAKFFVINELKSSDNLSYALVEMTFSSPVQLTTLTYYSTAITPELLVSPVSDLRDKVTLRARGTQGLVTVTSLNILIEPGDFRYFDTTNPLCVQPGLVVDLGINSPTFNFETLRHFRKSTSRHEEYGPTAADAGNPGQTTVTVPNELPSTVVKTHQTYVVSTPFSSYPYTDVQGSTPSGTKFGFCTRVQPIWQYPVEMDINLTGGTLAKLQFKAPFPTGYAYPIIPIGQQNGISTGVTNGVYENKGLQKVFDYRLHNNYYSGLWVTT